LSNRFSKIKDLSSIGIADVIGSGISSVFWFYLATLIEPEAYGELNYLISIARIASTISLLGATQSLLVYSAKNVRIHATLYSISLIIGVISSIIVVIIVGDFAISILVIGYMIFAIAYSDLLGKKYFKTYTKYILVQKILMISLGIGFYFIFGINGIILGIGISFFIGILRIIYGFRDTKIDFRLFKKKFSFISFNYMNSVTYMLHGSLDKIIIGPLFGFVLLGNYSLGLQFLSILLVLPIIVGKYIIPTESSGTENKKIKKIIILFSIVIGILGFLIGPDIGSFLFPKFLEIDSILRIVSLAVIPSTISITYSSKFLSYEKSNYMLFIAIIRTTIMILSIIILGNLYGIQGLVVGIVLSDMGAAIFSVIMAKRIKINDSRK
jgi:O-antigen/teichoic acid export membrane protein